MLKGLLTGRTVINLEKQNLAGWHPFQPQAEGMEKVRGVLFAGVAFWKLP